MFALIDDTMLSRADLNCRFMADLNCMIWSV